MWYKDVIPSSRTTTDGRYNQTMPGEKFPHQLVVILNLNPPCRPQMCGEMKAGNSIQSPYYSTWQTWLDKGKTGPGELYSI